MNWNINWAEWFRIARMVGVAGATAGTAIQHAQPIVAAVPMLGNVAPILSVAGALTWGVAQIAKDVADKITAAGLADKGPK